MFFISPIPHQVLKQWAVPSGCFDLVWNRIEKRLWEYVQVRLWMGGAMVPGPSVFLPFGPWSQPFFAVWSLVPTSFCHLVPGPSLILPFGPHFHYIHSQRCPYQVQPLSYSRNLTGRIFFLSNFDIEHAEMIKKVFRTDRLRKLTLTVWTMLERNLLIISEKPSK